VVLDGQRVVPARAQEVGYAFKYTKVQDALRNVLNVR
jgi:NAD dependent epimerase/dehydratase family enzyme